MSQAFRDERVVSIIIQFAPVETLAALPQVSSVFRGVFRSDCRHLRSGLLRDLYYSTNPWSLADLAISKVFVPETLSHTVYTMDLLLQPNIPNLVVLTLDNKIVLWLTDVPNNVRVSDLLIRLEREATLVAAGKVLSPLAALSEVVWPTRRGRKGWRGNLLVYVSLMSRDLASSIETVVPEPWSR